MSVASTAEFILFHSEECSFSRDVMWKMDRLGLQNHIFCVSVDDDSLVIPPNITCVPTVVARTTRKIYTDDNIDALLKALASAVAGKSASASAATAAADVEPTAASESYKGATDAFSFIDDAVTDTGSRKYIPIDMIGAQSVPQGAEAAADKENKGGNKLDESHYDKYLSQRDNDIASMFPRQQPQY
ncbi:hypothetical protein FOA52_011844 [Chlamydomonas sp. UWO 241]|nr:hypothetical protein FOA52_011844 [Chlamydomonas sp. UWO 241]